MNCIFLDDEFVEFFKRYNLHDNLVHINYLTGITEKDVKKAIEILNEYTSRGLLIIGLIALGVALIIGTIVAILVAIL